MKMRVSALLALMCVMAAPAGAQVVTISGSGVGSPVAPFREYATRELKDPWDMSQRSDIGWLTWGVDQPQPNMSALTMATDAAGNTLFRGTPTSNDPSFFLLDTWQPGSAPLGKVGVNYRIDTTTYDHFVVKVRFANELLAANFDPSLGPPQSQIYWSRDTIYWDQNARPNGGSYTTASADGGEAGVPLLPQGAQPFNSLEGGVWVIYRFPFSIAGLQAFNGAIAKWRNVNDPTGTSDIDWGAAGLTADSLRFKPINYSAAGNVEVDWARLVSYDTSNPITVSWTDGSSFDIVVSTQTDCSDYAVLDYSKATGHAFPAQMLPPGTYHVGLRPPFLSTGQTPGAVICSAQTFTVQALPTMTFTSPNPEGSADDFATTFLANPWDMDAASDIDFTRNIPLADAEHGIVTRAATDPAGNDLGNVRVYRGTSVAATAGTGGVGDPHFYTLWPVRMNGATPRGINNRIDAGRYRIFTTEVGLERSRDVNLGSIARIVWHVAGDKDAEGNSLENVTQDIVLRHLDPAANGGKIVLETIQADMADRGGLPLETDTPGSPSTTGWTNTCALPSAATCGSSAAHKPGLDIFRFDPHEFDTATDFDVKRIKLAALERTGSSFNIQWTSSNPNSLAATVSLFALGYRDAAAKDLRPSNTTCTGGIAIASNLSLDANSYTWTPGTTSDIVAGSEYFVCAQILLGGTVVQEATAKWPVVVDTSFTGLKPTLHMDRTNLRFSGVHSGQVTGELGNRSPAETIRIVQQGSGTVSWTLTAKDTNGGNIDWLSISKTSGSGSDTFTIGLADSPSLPSCSALDGLGATITLTSDAAGNAPQYVQVYVTIRPGAGVTPPPGCSFTAGVTNPPFGQVDTPVQNATGVVGAIGVTGWVLDDLGVNSVKIYRNCLAFDNQASCQPSLISGLSLVFVGDAAFLAGARPDVERSFETSPFAYRAGWGYLMLSSMLPHVTNAQNYGGHGPLTLYAVATDVEGKTTVLGRTQMDSTPTSITMDNDNIAKPFGAIDTPGQGETVSGLVNNFGWVLTPDTNTTAGEVDDIVVPTDGSTATVFIDGVPLAKVPYNQCRGDVGNPVPAGVFCNDDVANIFGNLTPQPALQARTSNPTRYRNLDSERAAIGAYTIDTTTMTNGLHTIAWGVTDSAGRSEGIGSRFFNVLNGASDAATARAFADLPAMIVADGAEAMAIASQQLAAGRVYGRTTFDLNAPWEEIDPGASGEREVHIPEIGRLELWLGRGVTNGYLSANGTLRPLPPGSRLRDGQFTWAPAPGYIGAYRLVFSGIHGQIPVSVTIAPRPANGPAVRAHIDTPSATETVHSGFTVAGWALDTQAWQSTGIRAVHVWAFRRDGVGAGLPVTFLGAASLGGERPDVAAVEGARFLHSGWGLTTSPLPVGEYEVVAYYWSTRTGRFEDASSVIVTVR